MIHSRARRSLRLEHGKCYVNPQGDIVKIRKEKWDCYFMAFSLSGTFMGMYDDDGSTIEGLPKLHDLIQEYENKS
jgi:hypothetical protein